MKSQSLRWEGLVRPTRSNGPRESHLVIYCTVGAIFSPSLRGLLPNGKSKSTGDVKSREKPGFCTDIRSLEPVAQRLLPRKALTPPPTLKSAQSFPWLPPPAQPGLHH